MFEVGFSELLLISVIALIVLGPERLPKLVAQVGRWVGKARSMARTFREQLESEVNLEELNRTPAKSSVTPSYPPPGEAPPNEVDAAQSDALATAHLTPEEQHTIDTQHHDTPDYPYAAPSEVGVAADTSHPEGDVYGGSAAPAPERIVTDEPAPAAAEATEPEPEPARLHDQRV